MRTILTICLSLAALTIPSAALGATGSPQGMVLRSPPAGTVMSKEGPLPNRAVTADYNTSGAALRAHGRVGGYFTFFSRPVPGDPPGPGLWTLDDQVDLYRTPTGAHWGFALLRDLERKGAKSTAVPAIGDERWAMTVHWTSEPTQYVYVLVFRRGQYVGFVESVFKSRPRLSQTISLAQKLDRKIQGHS